MKNEMSRAVHEFWSRTPLFVIGVLILGFVYVFQRQNSFAGFESMHPNTIFILNRTARLIVNDLACFLIIFALFKDRKYIRLAFYVFLLELLIVLPLYLVVKLSIEGDSEISSPLLSQVHRLIVNPMLMLLLIAGFVYQRFLRR